MSDHLLQTAPVRFNWLNTVSDTLTWFAQMRAALSLPSTTYPRSGPVEVARQVEHGINRYRGWGIDPRI